MSFMERAGLREPPTHLNFSPQLAGRPGTEELLNRDDRLKELRNKLEEEQKKLQQEKDTFEMEKKKFLQDNQKNTQPMSPVGPAYFPAPFRKQSHHGNTTISDEEEEIKKGRRSSMDRTSALFINKSNMDDTMSGAHSLRGGGHSPVESRVDSPWLSKNY